MIQVLVNERRERVPEGSTLGHLVERFKPGADVLVVNGFPGLQEDPVREGDRVALIRLGEIPGEGELESLMTARHTPGVHDRMKTATVGVAGLGGLGSAATIALARIGIGRLILADFDIVEPSNLNRQHYFIEHIGMAKTEAMKEVLWKINPYIQANTHHVVLDEGNIPEVFRSVDVVLECLDRAEAKAMFTRTIAECLPDVWLVGASGVAGFGDNNTIKTIQVADRIYMVGDLVTAAEPGRGLMAPRVGIAAHQQANLAVELLMDPERVKL
jgi:sulfur carrier protein ThiS adenylyltransferase